MFKERCISVTDLRQNTKECLENLEKGEKYIFVNNKPKAVLISIDMYEEYMALPRLEPLPPEQVTKELRAKVEKSKQKKKSEFMNI